MQDLSSSHIHFIHNHCNHQSIYHNDKYPNYPGLWFLITLIHHSKSLYFTSPTSTLYITFTYYSLYVLPTVFCPLKINANLLNTVFQVIQNHRTNNMAQPWYFPM